MNEYWEPLSDFQQSCEAALSHELSLRGRSLEQRSQEGERETYIRARISGSNITVFIYQDEAQFHRDSGKQPGIYERPDFRSLQALEETFIRDVVNAVGSASTQNLVEPLR